VKHKVVLLLGGIRGLNYILVKTLLEAGYKVYVNYRSMKSLQLCKKLKKEEGENSSNFNFLKGDVLIRKDIEYIIDEVFSLEGSIDIFIHTVGPFHFSPVLLTETSDLLLHEMFYGNLASFLFAIRKVIPVMRENKFGRVITFGFSNVKYFKAFPGYGIYASCKAGLMSLTATLAKEEVANGITVNMVCPGDIRTPYKEDFIYSVKSNTRNFNCSKTIRLGTGQDIARIVLFLISKDSDYITGAVIEATGGLHL